MLGEALISHIIPQVETKIPDNYIPVQMIDGIAKPRGANVATEHGALVEHFGKYLAELIRDTGGPFGVIGVQYIVNPRIRYAHMLGRGERDSLDEAIHEAQDAPGLVYNYKGGVDAHTGKYHPGRGLLTVTTTCAAYCTFCTRGDVVGKTRKGYINPDDRERTLAHKDKLTKVEIDQVFQFYRDHPEINEVIISGGDFMIADEELFRYVIDGFAKLQQEETKYDPYRDRMVPVIEIIRIGSRVLLQNADAIKDWRIEYLKKIKHLRLMLHINNPKELTPKVLEKLDKFQEIPGINIYSQSVFLRGVNAVLKEGCAERIHEQDIEYEIRQGGPDNKYYLVPVKDNTIDEDATIQLLIDMFQEFAAHGINPYYLFQNDEVLWAILLTVPAPQTIRIIRQVMENLISGMANKVELVFDNGNGKKSALLLDPDAAGYIDNRGIWVAWGPEVDLLLENFFQKVGRVWPIGWDEPKVEAIADQPLHSA